MYYLIKYTGACDLEFLVHGMAIVSKNLWENIIEETSYIKFPFSIALGKNQEVAYDDGIDLLRDFTLEVLTKEEAYVIIDKVIMSEIDYIEDIEDINSLMEFEFLVEYGIFPDMFRLIS